MKDFKLKTDNHNTNAIVISKDGIIINKEIYLQSELDLTTFKNFINKIDIQKDTNGKTLDNIKEIFVNNLAKIKLKKELTRLYVYILVQNKIIKIKKETEAVKDAEIAKVIREKDEEKKKL